LTDALASIPEAEQELRKYEIESGSKLATTILRELIESRQWFIKNELSEVLSLKYWPIGVQAGNVFQLDIRRHDQATSLPDKTTDFSCDSELRSTYQEDFTGQFLNNLHQEWQASHKHQRYPESLNKSVRSQYHPSDSGYSSQSLQSAQNEKKRDRSAFRQTPHNSIRSRNSTPDYDYSDAYSSCAFDSSSSVSDLFASRPLSGPSGSVSRSNLSNTSLFYPQLYDPHHTSRSHFSVSKDESLETRPTTTVNMPQNIYITAYFNLPLPCIYPPTGVKMQKCSFSPSTAYWKALKALSGSNKAFRVYLLSLTQKKDGEKVLKLNKTITGARDRALSEFGFTSLDSEQSRSFYILLE